VSDVTVDAGADPVINPAPDLDGILPDFVMNIGFVALIA